MADLFASNGYVTGMVGKWHTGLGEEYHPLQRGFEEFVGATFMARDVPSYYNYTLDVQGTPTSYEDRYLTEEFTDRAIDFIQRNHDEPFFLHLAHYAPHRPLEAPEETIQSYRAQGLGEEEATIYAMIEVMDREIGRLLDELNQLGLRDNTIVIFASDNGPDPVTGTRYNRDLRGTKYTVYEGGLRIPLSIHWPDRIEPGTRDEVVTLTDILPTLINLCNLQVPVELELDGASLAGVLSGGEANLPARRFWQWNRGTPYYTHNAAVREGPWKLVRPYVTSNLVEDESAKQPVLYNLEDDPSETNDVSSQHPERYRQLDAALHEWSTEVERDRQRKH